MWGVTCFGMLFSIYEVFIGFLRYPDYEILGDPDIAKTAAIGTRYSDTSLYGIIIDIHFLSRCDFLVCTFSSQVHQKGL